MFCLYSYLFIDFKSPESAHAAVKNLDGHKLSKSVTLSVNKFTDVEKYSDMNEEYVEPQIEPYTAKEHLKSALMDPQARDQFVMYRGDDVSIFWNRKTDSPEHVYSRTVSLLDIKILNCSNIHFMRFVRTGLKPMFNGLLRVLIFPHSIPKVLLFGVVHLGTRLFVLFILVSS